MTKKRTDSMIPPSKAEPSAPIDEMEVCNENMDGGLQEEEPVKVVPALKVTQPEKYLMPINKFSQNFTNVVMGKNTMKRVMGDRYPDINSVVILRSSSKVRYQGTPLTDFDRCVLDAVATLYVYGHQDHIITPALVYRTMIHATETETPSKKILAMVEESIEKMRFIYVQIDCSEELKKRKISLNEKPVNKGVIGDMLLCVRDAQVEAGGNVIKAYLVKEAPIVYEYAHLIKQVCTIDGRLLEIKDSMGIRIKNSEKRIAIKRYLLSRIEPMKGRGGGKLSRKIKYESIYEQIANGIKVSEEIAKEEGKPPIIKWTHGTDFRKWSRDVTLNIRKYVVLCLEYWQAEGYIDGYEKDKNGITIIV